jgi:transposase-like protein
MPDAGEVLGAYRQVGTVSGLAEHFGVPRHTVQSWAKRLRREGHTIGRS